MLFVKEVPGRGAQERRRVLDVLLDYDSRRDIMVGRRDDGWDVGSAVSMFVV